MAIYLVYLIKLKLEQSFDLDYSIKAEATPYIRYILTIFFISKLLLAFLYPFIRKPISLAIKTWNKELKKKPSYIIVDKRAAALFRRVRLALAYIGYTINRQDIVQRLYKSIYKYVDKLVYIV